MVTSLHLSGNSSFAFKRCSQAHAWKCSCIISWMITHGIVNLELAASAQGWLFHTEWPSLIRDVHHPEAEPPSPAFLTVLVLSSEIKHMLIKLLCCPALSVGARNTSLLQNSSVTEICYGERNHRFSSAPGISDYRLFFCLFYSSEWNWILFVFTSHAPADDSGVTVDLHECNSEQILAPGRYKTFLSSSYLCICVCLCILQKCND